MKNNKRFYITIAIIIFCCAVMSIIDGVIKPGYFTKSIIKIILFLAFPIIYSVYDKELSLKRLVTPRLKGLIVSILMGLGVYIFIIIAYFIFRNIFDFSKVTGAITTNTGINKKDFVFVAIYISFINSLLEEFFFRGFAFLTLKKLSTRKFAYIFSSCAFTLYHIAMMIGWFSIEVYILLMFGLFAGGLIFNYLNEKNQNIFASWMVHMFANFAINTVGFILFGII